MKDGRNGQRGKMKEYPTRKAQFAAFVKELSADCRKQGQPLSRRTQRLITALVRDVAKIGVYDERWRIIYLMRNMAREGSVRVESVVGCIQAKSPLEVLGYVIGSKKQ